MYGMYAGLMKNRMTKIDDETVEEFNGIYQKGRDIIICSNKDQRDRIMKDYPGGSRNGEVH